MKKHLLFAVTAVMLFAAATLNAQQNYHRCSTMEYLEEQLKADPTLAARMQEIEQHTQHFIQQNEDASRAVVTIPVVVHVVYNTAAQNISDAQINAQIAQLNADFARLNSDAGNTPSAFAGLAANTNIQFCLAQRDPSGNPTTGIVRKQTTVTSFSSNDAVKKSSQGGSDAWPASSYLNLWSCNLGGGLLGYAQFPGGAASTDGVVVLYSSVGSLAQPGTASPYHYGRTATHEVGHWLNLRHIWGDDNTACTGSDQVNDTPNQAGYTSGCPLFPKTDACSPSSPGVMFMNYMDYSYDGCMNMFTQGQSSRMNALFSTGGARVSLLSSNGCNAATPTTCAVPSGLATSNITTTAANISWSAVSGAVSYNVQFRAVGGSAWTSGNVTSTAATLSGLSAATAYEWQVQTVCASSSSAFSSSATFTTLSASTCTDNYEANNTSGTAKTAPLNTNFNGLISPSGDVDWFKITTTKAAPKLKVDLTTLPADYDMVLYASNGSKVLASATQGGTANETLKYNASTKAATYYLKVYGYNGASNGTACYTLRVSTSASNFRTIGESADDAAIESVMAEPALKLYPNPAADKLTVEYLSSTAGAVTFRVYNLSGQLMFTNTGEAQEGFNVYSLNTVELSNGVYVLEINTGGETQRQKFSIGQ
ncbi:MAG: T9SS type A sorting domain-containing protein [Chitinophagales bacterium]|nr:T9SS type A sorting domain-containing protein [Chitinophagales bacterium]